MTTEIEARGLKVGDRILTIGHSNDFHEIAAIPRRTSRCVTVTLASGENMMIRPQRQVVVLR